MKRTTPFLEECVRLTQKLQDQSIGTMTLTQLDSIAIAAQKLLTCAETETISEEEVEKLMPQIDCLIALLKEKEASLRVSLRQTRQTNKGIGVYQHTKNRRAL